MDQHLLGVEGCGCVTRREPDCSAGRRLRRGERTVAQRATGALDEVVGRRHRLAGSVGQLGGQLERGAGQARVGPLVGGPRPRGEIAPLGREQVADDRLPGERVPEREARAVDLDELLVDRGAQAFDGFASVDLGDPGEQLPVEAPAQERGRAEHAATRGREGPEPALDRLPQAGGDRWRQVTAARPVPVLEPELARRHQPREQLLDEEGAAVAVRVQERLQVGRRRRHAEAGGQHAVHLGVAERRDAHDGRRVAPLEPADQVARGPVGPARAEAEDRLGPQGVGQVVEHGEGLGVGPVHVLEEQHAPPFAAVHREQPHHRLAEQHGRLRRPDRPAAPGGDEAADVALEPGERRVLGRSGRAEGGQEGLGERPIGQRAVPGHGPSRQHGDRTRRRRVDRVLGQTGLPRARVTDQHDEAASLLREILHPGLQQLLLAGPAHQLGAQHGVDPRTALRPPPPLRSGAR